MSDITGNAGVAGATVNLGGDAVDSVVADGSGNFTFTGLGDGDYTLTPVLSGYFFFPNVMTRTISGSTLTDAKFGAVAVPLNIYTEVEYQSPYAADQNPIDPINWEDSPGLDPLQILNNRITSTNGNASNFSFLDGNGDISTAGYGHLNIGDLVDGAAVGVVIMSSDLLFTTFYEFILARDGSDLNVFLTDSSSTLGSTTIPYVAQSLARIEYVNGILSGYIDGSLVLSAATVDSTSGVNGIEMQPVSLTTDVQSLDFVWGTIIFVAPNFDLGGNTGVAGVLVNMTGDQTSFRISDGSGNYLFDNWPVGTYHLVPVLAGYVFFPPFRDVVLSDADILDADFTPFVIGSGSAQCFEA